MRLTPPVRDKLTALQGALFASDDARLAAEAAGDLATAEAAAKETAARYEEFRALMDELPGMLVDP